MPKLGAAGVEQQRYIPRRSTNALKKIVEDHLQELERVNDERFAKSYGPLSRRVVELFERLIKSWQRSGFRVHVEFGLKMRS